jgi:2-dehydro-3-deoxygluconokinase
MAAYLQTRGVDTAPVFWTGNRVGAYYLPQGSDLQHAGVIYDRAHSSFAGLGPGMIDWDVVLRDAGWFHFSAISPALNASVAALCREGLEAAARKGVRVSVDLNYRSKLWQYGVAPASVMPGLVDYCDLVMGNLWAAESLLGIPVDKDVHRDGSKKRYLEHSLATSEAILRQFPRCTRVAHTFRFEKISEGLQYYATLFERASAGSPGGRLTVSREFRTDAVVDKVGSGDCFMGGLIFAGLQGWDPQRTIDFAAAAAIGKLQEKGDATRQSVSQVLTTIERHA